MRGVSLVLLSIASERSSLVLSLEFPISITDFSGHLRNHEICRDFTLFLPAKLSNFVTMQSQGLGRNSAGIASGAAEITTEFVVKAEAELRRVVLHNWMYGAIVQRVAPQAG